MMTPNEFVRRYEQDWLRLETLIDDAHGRKHGGKRGSRGNKKTAAKQKPPDKTAFPALYRRVCQHLALARERHYPPALIERLDRLALAGHQTLYAARTRLVGDIGRFVAHDFPALVRERARLFWIASALLYLPALAMALLVYFQPEMVYSVFDDAAVRDFEKMYAPGGNADAAGANTAGVLGGRAAESNFVMFGYYIRNNISVGFQCFAAGLLYGLGTLFYLVFNGAISGAIAAHLIHQDSAERFFQFVVAHGAFELTAIVLCGTAGLMLGGALVSPGRRRRGEALIEAARPAVKIVYGATGMLFIAAFIEAFWSSGSYLPPPGKFIVGGALWAFVACYFLFMGKRHAP